MPPPLNRFPSGPSTGISPYQHQFPPHSQGHTAGHPPQLANPPYINPGGQLNPFTANGALSLAAAAGLNPGAAGFGVGAADSGLGSHAVRLGFTPGASLPQQQQQQPQQHPQHPQQQQQQQPGHAGAMLSEHPTRNQTKSRIREVWKHNLHEEMAVLRDLVEKYNYIAMDTEFPGLVCRPMGQFRGKSDYHYQCLRANVDMLNPIQLGITLYNADGDTPPARPNSTDAAELGVVAAAAGRRGGHQGPFPYSWQFNFRFSLKDDMYNQASIDSLVTAGVDFAALERDGCDPHEFAALMISSGMVCDDGVNWISFHGAYDFGYLTKLLWCKMLPNEEIEFAEIMKLFFPRIFDVKYHMKHQYRVLSSLGAAGVDPFAVDVLQKFEHKSTLETLTDSLKVKRVGAAHQAGSDSLLTGRAFFQMREKVFGGRLPEEIVGLVWGLDTPEGPTIGNPGVGGGGGGASGGGAGADAVGSNGGGAYQQHQQQHHHHQQSQSQQQQNGGPSTPNTVPAGLVSTPAASSHNTNGMGGGMGPMTPGGGGGVFGNFSLGNNR